VPARIEDHHEVLVRLEPLRPLTPGEIDRGVSEMTRGADRLRKETEASK
jgi:hypothetical protein